MEMHIQAVLGRWAKLSEYVPRDSIHMEKQQETDRQRQRQNTKSLKCLSALVQTVHEV